MKVPLVLLAISAVGSGIFVVGDDRPGMRLYYLTLLSYSLLLAVFLLGYTVGRRSAFRDLGRFRGVVIRARDP